MPARCLINIYESEVLRITLALGAARGVCEREKCDAIFCVPTKKLASDLLPDEVIPKAEIRKMLKGQYVLLGKAKLGVESIQTVSTHRQHGVIIAVNLSEEMMEKIDGITSCKGIIFVPWKREDGDQWRSRWNPVVIPVDNNDRNPRPSGKPMV
jgi:hypothetical protein